MRLHPASSSYSVLCSTLVQYIHVGSGWRGGLHLGRKVQRSSRRLQRSKFMFGWALSRIHLSMSSRSLRAFLFAFRQVSGPRGYQNGVRIQLNATSRSLVTNFSKTGGQYHQGVRLGPLMGVATLAASGIGFWNYFGREESEITPESRLALLPRLQAAEKKSDEVPKQKVSLREKRYKMFASVVYNEEPYMTPRDFIESLLQDEPRSKLI